MRTRRSRDFVAGLLLAVAVAAFPYDAAALAGDLVIKLLAPDGSQNDEFGGAVAVDGDIALVGARVQDGYTGSVYAYVRTDAGWQLETKLIAPDAKFNHFFGESLALSGNTAVIGARGDADHGFASGAVYVFTRTEAGWELEDKLHSLDAKSKDVFGFGVAVDGDTILVGAPGYSASGDTSGAAYVFTRDGTTWSQDAKLLATDDVTNADFGAHVALHNGVAVIGAHMDDDNGLHAGSAYVFARGSASWTQEARLLDPEGALGDFFGASVAVDGDMVAIGAPGKIRGYPANYGNGVVLLFRRSGTTWLQEARVIASDGSRSDMFGASVAVDGDRVVIGAPGDYPAGSTYVHTRTGTTWDEAGKLLPPNDDCCSHAEFGHAVAADGDTVVIGAWVDREIAWSAGSAYVFSLRDDRPPAVHDVYTFPNPVPVGSSVAITATIDDSAADGSTIASAEYAIDAGSLEAMSPTDGSFDSVVEEVDAAISAFAEAGVYTVCVSGTDSVGNTGTGECVLLVVYDPDSGFVTGGGWIDSPAGAYLDDPSLTGKANFGFVSRYKKGATTPTGNTEFQFYAGSLRFHSSSYDWLVVNRAGMNAQFKGSGTINDSLAPDGNPYEFMLWASDGDDDTFRIRIWYTDLDSVESEVDVYDNGFGQIIGGGAILVHKGSPK